MEKQLVINGVEFYKEEVVVFRIVDGYKLVEIHIKPSSELKTLKAYESINSTNNILQVYNKGIVSLEGKVKSSDIEMPFTNGELVEGIRFYLESPISVLPQS